MARYTPSGNVSSIPQINSELEKISEAMKDLLSRKGDSPNQMEGIIDLNSNRLVNAPAPSEPDDLVRLQDIEALSGEGASLLPPQEGQDGEFLRTDGSVAFWDAIPNLDLPAVYPEDFGAVGDGVTDDTAALQAAIDSVQGSGSLGLPTGFISLKAKTYMHTGLNLNRAISIQGEDRNASRLKCLETGLPAITVRLGHDGNNYQQAGRMGPTIAIKDVLIESNKQFGSSNHGIFLENAPNSAIRGWVYLDGVDIHSMGGSALFANTWEGAVKATGCKFLNNAGKQVNATSCADWQFVGSEFGVTPDDNILLSGCAAFTFTTCNIYSSTGDLVTLFTDASATAPVNHHFVSCSFDRASAGHGIVYNVRNSGNVTFTNCYWTYNSQGAPETFSDIFIDASVRRGPTIVGGWMQDASTSDSLFNIFFNGNLSSCYTTGVQFEAGSARSASVTNSLPQLKFEGAENFNTFAEAQACTWAEEGDKVFVRERANAQYLTEPSSATSLTGDITTASGKILSLQLGNVADVLNFGVYDTSDISPLVEIALNSERATKYKLEGSYIALTKVEVNVSDVVFDIRGASIDCTNLEYDASFQGGGAWLRFRGFIAKNTSVVGSISAKDKTVTFSDTSGLQVGDIVRLFSNEKVYSSGTIDSNKIDINRISDINISSVTLDYPVDTDWDGATFPISAEVLRPLRNCHVIGGDILGGGATESPLQNGRGQSSVFFFAVDNYSVKDMSVRDMYANALSTERCLNGIFDRIDIVGRDFDVVPVEGINSSWYGMYAIRSRNITMSNSTGVRVRHMCDATSCISVTQVNNRSTDSHRAAFGTHESVYDCVIERNYCEGGSSGITLRSFDAIVTDNVLNAEVGITTAGMQATDVGGELTISNNRIRSYGSSTNISITGVYDYLNITGNTLKGSPRGILFSTERINNCNISDNVIGSNISIEFFSGAQSISGVSIKDNVFKNFTQNAVEFRGSTQSSTPADGISIDSNTCIGSNSGSAILLRGEGFYGENVSITNNKMVGDTSLCVQITNPQAFAYFPIIEGNEEFNKNNFTNRVVAFGSSPSVASGANVLKGSLVNRISPAAGQPSQWVCTSSGTEGSVTGVTGDISSGSDQITFSGNSSTGVTLGAFITIAGAGSGGSTLQARVVEIANDYTSGTLSVSASTTVSGATVQRNNPTFGVVSTIS